MIFRKLMYALYNLFDINTAAKPNYRKLLLNILKSNYKIMFSFFFSHNTQELKLYIEVQYKKLFTLYKKKKIMTLCFFFFF